jgi:tetratricopeptide (TPR) repeat protein
MRSSVECHAIESQQEEVSRVSDCGLPSTEIKFRRESCNVQICRARAGRKHALLLGLLLGCWFHTAVGQSARPKVSGIRTHFQQAEAALKANDADTATREFRAILTLDPRNAEAHFNLGVLEALQGDCQSASQDLRQALASQPSLIQARAMLGVCGRRLGDKSAKALLEGSFSKLSDAKLRTQVGMELVGIYYGEGDPERAVPVLQKLVELNPENADILYMAQRLYAELADDTLNKLAVVAPGSARMQQVIAERLVNAGDLEGAIEHYRKTLEIDPHVPGVRYELAEAILESSSRSDAAAQAEAEKELGTVVATEGDSAKVECQLAKIALLRSDTESAHDHYVRAFALHPQDTEAQLGLGRILMTMEKGQEARKYLELAVQSDPLNGEAHYRLAQVYQRLQMPDESQKQMHLFQEIKRAKDQVRMLYRQMKKQTKAEDEDAAGRDQ